MRQCIAAAAIFLMAGTAAAQEAGQSAPSQALGEVFACADITEEAARLACYDGAVGRLRQAEAQGRVIAVDRQQVETLERDAFGFSLPSIAGIFRRGEGEVVAPVERVEAEVARVVRSSDGRHSFVLANGQIWAQVEPQSANNVRVGDTVAIRRAALGSFMLSPEFGRAHRVRRTE